MSLDAIVREYAEFRKGVEEADAALDERKAQLKEMEKAVLTHFENEGVASIKVDGLGSFARRSTARVSIPAENKERAIGAIREFAPDLIQETVNSNTLSGWYREAKKSGRDISPVEPLLSVYEDRGISWTRNEK
jgi:hypothetical protein